MKPTEKQAFYTAYAAMAEHHNLKLSRERLTGAFAYLEDIPFDMLEMAMHAAIQTQEFFPTIAALRKLAGASRDVLMPEERAWLALRNRQTRYNRDALSDPMIRTVFEAMGGGYVLDWGFGNWPSEQEEMKRKEFLSRYRELRNAHAINAGASFAPHTRLPMEVAQNGTGNHD